MTEARLSTDRITFAYRLGRDVLRDVTLSVGPQEVLFVLGANGSGKTTLLECLAGIRSPRSGRILLGGDAACDLAPSERARRVGLVPQIHEPVFDYTVGDVVLMGRAPRLGLFARPGPRDREAVDRALGSVGLGSLRDRVYTQISGGERQLALIARGLAQGAGCLLMDEPAAHLDPRHQLDVFRAVRNLADEGTAFIVTSHRPNSALLHADRVAVLAEGRIEVEGSPDDVVNEEILAAAYGIPFELVGAEGGSRAILPRLEAG